MAMFQTAVKHVAKSSGSKSLHPVPDLNSASHFQTMSLVKRKTSFWFWKKAKMIPTQMTLGDLFEESLDVPKAKVSTLLEDFTETPTLKIDGSIGTKIASELNLSLSGSDTMSLTIKLGDVVKSEVDWEGLQEALEQQRIKTNHALLSEVRKSKRTTLCVVLESLATKAEGDLEGVTDAIVKTDDSEELKKSVITVNINEKGQLESKLTHSFKIPPSTVLAYSCNEFSINSVGMASLHSAIDRYDSAKEPLFLKNSDGSDPIDVVRVEFQPLMKSDKFDHLRKEFKQLIETATNDVISSMHLLLSAAEFKIENKAEERTLSPSTVQQLFQGGGNPNFNSILKNLGFALPDDFDGSDKLIRFPDANYDLIKAVILLLDALTDIDAGVRMLLAKVSQENCSAILKIVLNEIENSDNKLKSDTLTDLFKKDPSCQLLLKNAGFVEMKIDDEDFLVFTRSKHFHLMDLYSVLYVLSH